MLKKIILMILCTGFIAAESKSVILNDLQKPGAVLIDESQIYITEGASIYVYSVKDFKLIRKFGKNGEGPKEFKVDEQRWGNLFLDVSTKDIVIHSMGKISWFSKKGVFKKEKKFYTNPLLHETKNFGKNYLGKFITQDKKRYRGLRVYDINQKLIKELVKKDDVYQRGKGMDVFKYSTANSVYKNKLYMAWGEEFIIKVINTDFKSLNVIKYPYKRIKVIEKNRKEILDFYKKDPRTRDFYNLLKPFKFNSHFPAINDLFATGNKLFVITNKKKDGKTELLMFTPEGKFIKQTFFPLKMETPTTPYPYTIFNNTIYQLEEDIEEEEWKLNITKI